MLENINGSDQGSEAIKKLDRNSRKLLELITSLSDADIELLRQINVLSSGKLDNMIEKMSQSLNQKLDVGQYHFQNATDGFPDGYTLDNDFALNVYPSSKGNIDLNRMILLDIRSDRIFTQRRNGGTLKGWKELATTTKTDISLTLVSGTTGTINLTRSINDIECRIDVTIASEIPSYTTCFAYFDSSLKSNHSVWFDLVNKNTNTVIKMIVNKGSTFQSMANKIPPGEYEAYIKWTCRG